MNVRQRIDWDNVRQRLTHNQQLLDEINQQDPQELLEEFRRRAERLRKRKGLEQTQRNLLPVLVCRLASERYAIELKKIRQVYACPRVTPVPGAPPAVLGLASFQGDVFNVLDPRLALGLPKEQCEGGYVLLIQREQGRVGLWVEQAEEVLQLDLDSLSAFHRGSEEQTGGFVRGVSEDHVLLLDCQRLLQAIATNTEVSPAVVT